MKDDMNSWNTSLDQKRTNLEFKLTQVLQASQIEPELGTAQPQFV
jgi:hypothetical protein